MKETGKYFIVRMGWRCNICGKMYYTDKKRKPHCNSAPYIFSEKYECQISKELFLKIKKQIQGGIK